jgi:ATP-dependent RNA helicase RhlE
MSFSLLGLSAGIQRAITEQGYQEPTPIQRKVITPILQGRDLLAAAQTGTGKTAAFTLPLLERLSTEANKPSASRAAFARLFSPPLASSRLRSPAALPPMANICHYARTRCLAA